MTWNLAWRALARVDDLKRRAMAQPFPNVWLPKGSSALRDDAAVGAVDPRIASSINYKEPP